MRVLVAGATGAIGKQLVPRLVAAGHEVHGMTRSESKQAMLHELGAVPVVADALDPDQVAEAVGSVRPNTIVHQLTAIGALDTRHFDRDFALTNRLRTEGTDHLLSAGQAAGVRRFVAQSYFAGYQRTGGPVKSEDDPVDPSPAREMRQTMAAIRHVEEAVLGARWTEGIVLRYGAFYGPGTSIAPGGEQFELVRRRKFPLVGDGGGVWSFIHVADAAEAGRDHRRPLARRFFAAAEQGDLAGLEALLAHDVGLTGDGGGKVPALARSLGGRDRVARTLINWVRLGARLPGVSVRPVEINGGPGALFLDAQRQLIAVWALDIAGGQITSISSIVNPDKLTHLGPVGDFASLMRSAR
jgi:nucleoside-diphosphate-sugar epimerase